MHPPVRDRAPPIYGIDAHVNVLAELIPGARQLRTPLAIGYLWLTVAWINAWWFEKHTQKNTLLSRAMLDFGFHRLSPTLVVIILSFVAYLIGIFFQIIDNIIVTLLIFVTSLFVPFIILLIFSLAQPYLLLSLLVFVLLLVGFALHKGHRYHTDAGNEITQWLMNALVLLGQSSFVAKRIVFRVWSPASAVREGLAIASIGKILDGNPEVAYRFSRTLDSMLLRFACNEVGLRSDGEKIYGVDGRTIELSKAASRSWVNSDCERILRHYLLSRMLADRSAAMSAIFRVMKKPRIHGLVKGAVNVAQTRIRADERVIFEDSDRLRTEGEFRRGVAVPMAAILASIGVYYTARPILIAAAALPTVLVYISGISKEEQAAAMIIDCITAGLVEPDLSELEDVRLLRWRIQDIANEKAFKSKLYRLSTLQNRRQRKAGPEQGRLF